jgi:hypothetical protein
MAQCPADSGINGIVANCNGVARSAPPDTPVMGTALLLNKSRMFISTFLFWRCAAECIGRGKVFQFNRLTRAR